MLISIKRDAYSAALRVQSRVENTSMLSEHALYTSREHTVAARARRSASLNGVVLVALFFCISLIVFSLNLFQHENPVFTLTALLCIILAVVIALKGQVALVSPLIILIGVTTLFYILRPLYLVLVRDATTLARGLNYSSFSEALSLIIIFVTCMFVGYFLPVGEHIGRRLPMPFSPIWSARRDWLISP
jgi:hypothetical protein